MTADRPEISPPVGLISENSTPLALATGIASESGLKAALARTLGLTLPVSALSTEALIESISTSPM